MIHITVGIAQFFVILLTQMATLLLSLLAVGAVACGCALLLYRRVSNGRRRIP